jgi:hypothetical protein
VPVENATGQPEQPLEASEGGAGNSEKQNKVSVLKQRQQEMIQQYRQEKDALTKSFQEKMALFEESQHYQEIHSRLMNELSRRQEQLKMTFEEQLLNAQKEERLLRFGREDLNLWAPSSQEGFFPVEDEETQKDEGPVTEAKRQFLLRREANNDDQGAPSSPSESIDGSAPASRGTIESAVSGGDRPGDAYQKRLRRKIFERYKQRQAQEKNKP